MRDGAGRGVVLSWNLDRSKRGSWGEVESRKYCCIVATLG